MLILNAIRLLVGLLEEPMPRLSNQAQAAEDILDKYRNIKRPSPSDGAAAGASYDGTGGQEQKSAAYTHNIHLVEIVFLTIYV